MISVRNLRKSYNRKLVLRDVSIDFPEGRTTAIVGPNASGKTTLVKCILGLVIPDEGEIRANRKDIAYMPQDPNFPENLRVRELLSMMQDIEGRTSRNLDELVEVFSLREHLDKFVGELSYGTKQKVNATLSLMFEKPVLILDEPTVGMDPITSAKFRNMLSNMNRTIIFISHIVSEIERFAHELVFLMDGRVIFHGSLHELESRTSSSNLEEAIVRILEDAHGSETRKV